jgi:hypothetical protein
MITADIRTLLTDLGTVFIGDYGDSPDDVIVLYESGGYDPELSKDGIDHEHPTIQVRVRSTTYAAGIAICEVVKDRLGFINNLTINNHKYMTIRQSSDILPLGKDSKLRSEFSLNFEIRVRR